MEKGGKRKRKEEKLEKKFRQLKSKRSRSRSHSRGRRSGGGGRGQKNSGGGGDKSKEDCYSFSKGFGACTGCEPGSSCSAGRKHRCDICGGAHKAAARTKKKPRKEEPG